MPISVTGHSFALIGVGGGLGIVLFDAIEAGQAIVVLFDDGRVEDLFAVGSGAGSGMHHPVLGRPWRWFGSACRPWRGRPWRDAVDRRWCGSWRRCRGSGR